MIKKFFAAIIAVIILLAMPLSVAAAGTRYTDSTTGVSFTVPVGWSEDEFYEDREFLKVKFTPEIEDGATIMLGYSDMWSELSASEKIGYTRADINHEFMKNELAGEDLATALGIGEEECISDSVFYNGTEYMRFKYATEISAFGVSIDMTIIMLYHFYNGYMIAFQYADIDNNPHLNEYEAMINSVTYPTVSSGTGTIIDNSSSSATSSIYVPSYDYNTDNTTDTNNETGKGSGIVYFEDGKMKFDFPLFIISLIVTIIIYSLPIIIYRYGIKKQPIHEKKAKKITIIYGIIAFIVMAVVSGGAPGAAIILWSTVNYKMLTKPSKNDVYLNNETNYAGPEAPAVSQPTEYTTTKETEITKDPEPVSYNADEKIEEIQPKESEGEDKPNQEQPPVVEQENVVGQPKPIENAAQPVMLNKVLFCRKCGTRLTVDSEFCHKCGIRVIK